MGALAKIGDVVRPTKTAVVFIIDEALFRRNNLENKLAKRGVRVKRLAFSQSVEKVDLTIVDLVIYIDGALTPGQRTILVDRAAREGKECVCLSHRTSDPSWGILDAIAHVPMLQVVGVPEAPRPDADAALLASMYAGENEELKEKLRLTEENARKRVDALEKELEEAQATLAMKSGWVVEREQLVTQNTRAIAERKEAVRVLEALRTEMTDRLAAAERERREEVARIRGEREAEARAGTALREDNARLSLENDELKTRGTSDSDYVSKRVVAIVRAHDDGVLSEGEMHAKLVDTARSATSWRTK